MIPAVILYSIDARTRAVTVRFCRTRKPRNFTQHEVTSLHEPMRGSGVSRSATYWRDCDLSMSRLRTTDAQTERGASRLRFYIGFARSATTRPTSYLRESTSVSFRREVNADVSAPASATAPPPVPLPHDRHQTRGKEGFSMVRRRRRDLFNG